LATWLHLKNVHGAIKESTEVHEVIQEGTQSNLRKYTKQVRLVPKNNESVFFRLLKTDLYRRGWAEGACE